MSDFSSNIDENSPFSESSINHPNSVCSVNLCFPFTTRNSFISFNSANLIRFSISYKTSSIQIETSKESRKYQPDDIRKRYKSTFHKTLYKRINYLLKKAGSKRKLKSLPQIFIIDISLSTNYEVLEKTYEELFEYTYEKVISEMTNPNLKNYKKKLFQAALKKHEKNVKTMEYLRANPEISKKSGWESIKNMKYADLLVAYYNSKEFELSVEKLKQKEDKNYIKKYLFFASIYLDYYRGYNPSISQIRNPLNNTQSQNSLSTINNRNDSNNSFFMSIPPILPLNEEEQISSIDMMSSLYSSGIDELENRESLFPNENGINFDSMILN